MLWLWFTAQCFSAFWTQISNQRISCSFLCQNPHSNPSHFVHTVAHAPLKHLSVCMNEGKGWRRGTNKKIERDPGSWGKCDFLVSWVALLERIRCTITNFKFLILWLHSSLDKPWAWPGCWFHMNVWTWARTLCTWYFVKRWVRLTAHSMSGPVSQCVINERGDRWRRCILITYKDKEKYQKERQRGATRGKR